MKVYFTQENNKVLGFYNDEQNKVIPTGAIEITEAIRDTALQAESTGKCLCVSNNVITPQDYPSVPFSKWDGSKWVNDDTNIEKYRQQVKDTINTAYDYERTTKNTGITSIVLNAVIDCRESDVLNMTNVAYMMEQTGVATIDYKCKDNSRKTITLAQLKQVNCELIAAQLGYWQKWDGLKASIDSATTVAQLQDIVW